MITKELRIQLNNLTDEQLVDKIKNGEVELYREIMKRYNQRMYRTAISFGIDNDDSEDMIQQAYIAAYEKMDQFKGEAKFSTWLTKILINECLMLKRKTKTKNNKIERLTNNSVTSPVGLHQTPENSFMEKETKQILESAVKKLPEKYRTAYLLREIEGMSVKETSDSLEISDVNVKIRLHRAKAMLKDILEESYDKSDLFTFGNERCDRVSDNVMKYIASKENKNGKEY